MVEQLSYTPKAFVGRQAPSFSGEAWNGKQITNISLSDYLGKYVVLFFYPLDFTFVCPTEIVSFSEAAEKFRTINTEVIGCSIDSAFSHKEFALKPRKEGGLAPLDIPLLSDKSHDISKDYGVHIDYGSSKGISLRGTFIIDPKGILKHISINDNNVGRNVDEIVRLVEAFQFSEKYGEVCPSKWKPGSKGMTPGDSDKLQQFWEEEHSKKK